MPQHPTPDGVDLFYTDKGHGSPVLLLHGWTCDSHDWSWLIPVLVDRGHRVIAVDHRGHGRSAVPTSGYTPTQLAADAADLLRGLGLDSAIVVGHSLGTMVGSVLAVENPELVAALVLVDPIYERTPEQVEPVIALLGQPAPQEAVAAVFGAYFYTDRAPAWLRTWHHRRVVGTADHVVRDCFLNLFAGEDAPAIADNSISYLARRNCPRLAVYGLEEGAAFERRLPVEGHDEIAVIEGGHWLHQERPDDFHALMIAWLERNGL